MAKVYDWVVVGAGFTGAVTAERLASQYGQQVLLIDRRPHLAGNAYDYRNTAGDLVHAYGPHIFHTNSDRIFSYLSQFTSWRPYFHKVLGHIDGQYVPIPFNLNSIAAVFPPALAARLTDKLIAAYGFGARPTILKMQQEAEDEELRWLADYIFEKVFKAYTEKQWGVAPQDLDASVTARVPVVVSRDDRYFQDRYQAMPRDGFEALFKRLTDHPGIDIELGVNHADIAPGRYRRMVYTGAVDEYFEYQHGALPYRSLRFEEETKPAGARLAVGTVNYPNEFDFTRITDFSRLTGEDRPTVTHYVEYPQPHAPGVNDAYYPVPSAAAREKLAPYQALAKALEGKIWFAGRLGDYQYYNMDQACGRALALVEKDLAPALKDGATT